MLPCVSPRRLQICMFTCLPVDERGYQLANGRSGQVVGDCWSQVLPGVTLTYASTPMAASTSWTIVTTTLTQTTSVGAIAVVGWNVKRAGATTTTTMASASTTSNSTASAVSSTTSSTALPSSSSTPPSDLSLGAKVGIGLGVSLGVIGLMMLLLAMCILRRQKQHQNQTPPYIGQNVDAAGFAPGREEVEPKELPTNGMVPELMGSHLQTLPELDVRHSRYQGTNNLL